MDGRFLYFGDGSNMLNERLRAPNHAPSATVLGRGHVIGRTLTFDKASDDGSGKCDIRLTADANNRVEGVLFWIADADKPGLDEAEGRNRGYAESVVDVVTENGTEPSLAYVATSTEAGRRPYHWYRALVIAGAIQYGLPTDYIARLHAVASQGDPLPQRPTKLQAEAVLKLSGVSVD